MRSILILLASVAISCASRQAPTKKIVYTNGSTSQPATLHIEGSASQPTTLPQEKPLTTEATKHEQTDTNTASLGGDPPTKVYPKRAAKPKIPNGLTCEKESALLGKPVPWKTFTHAALGASVFNVSGGGTVAPIVPMDTGYPGTVYDKKTHTLEIINEKGVSSVFPSVTRGALIDFDFEKNRYLVYVTDNAGPGVSSAVQHIVSDGTQLFIVEATNRFCSGAMWEAKIFTSIIEIEKRDLSFTTHTCEKPFANNCPVCKNKPCPAMP